MSALLSPDEDGDVRVAPGGRCDEVTGTLDERAVGRSLVRGLGSGVDDLDAGKGHADAVGM